MTMSDLCVDGLGAELGRERGLEAPECRSTRAVMHDYLGRHLAPRRRRRFETHMDGCAGCIRAFIDVREVAWTRRAVTETAALTITRAG